jgi:hypothetical protein
MPPIVVGRRAPLVAGRRSSALGVAGVQVGPDEPLELLELGGLADEDVLGDRVDLADLGDGLAVVLDDAGVDGVDRRQVLERVAATL